MKLLSGIFQVGGPGLTHSFDAASYLIKGKEGSLLIDCGTPEGYEELINNIKKTGTAPEEVKTILGTHGHYDHVGAAHLWKNDYGCRVFLHERDREQVETGDSIKTSAGILYGTKSEPCKVDSLLNEGDIFIQDEVKLEVIHTPGHTPGSVSFDVTQGEYRLLIAGDSIWGGFSQKIGSSEEEWRQSLDKITARHYDFFTFGHVGPQLIADADERLREAKMAFANYYNPWFKTFHETYRY